VKCIVRWCILSWILLSDCPCVSLGCSLCTQVHFSWFTPIKAGPLFVSLQWSQMPTVSLIMWFLRLYGLDVKDTPVVGYEHGWLLQSHVTCMLSDECLYRIPGLLNVNVCIQRLRQISRKMMPRQIKRNRSMADHKNPLMWSSWAENSETYGRVDSSVCWRSGEAGTGTSSSKRPCVSAGWWHNGVRVCECWYLYHGSPTGTLQALFQCGKRCDPFTFSSGRLIQNCLHR
jgi:hypothetical protein